jgi:putative lipoprotein
MRVVRGVLELPPGDRPEGVVHVNVRIEDVSRADAAAVVLTSLAFEATLPAASDTSPSVGVAFELPVDDTRLDDRRSYVLRGHVDVSGSGQVEPGDYLSTQAHPVLQRGASDEVRLPLRRI